MWATPPSVKILADRLPIRSDPSLARKRIKRLLASVSCSKVRTKLSRSAGSTQMSSSGDREDLRITSRGVYPIMPVKPSLIAT